VVREAEKLLEGRTIEGYINRQERVPAWSLVSLLAHATRADLCRLSAPIAEHDPAGWSGTIARLAGELVDRSYDEASLLRLQRDCLIPIELRLLGGTTPPPSTPAELYSMVAQRH
jgi:hypothetical protein